MGYRRGIVGREVNVMSFKSALQVVKRFCTREGYPELHQQLMRDYHAQEAARRARSAANYKQFNRMRREHLVP